MSSHFITVNILGMDIAFKPGADMERVKAAASLLEERYETQKMKSEGSPGKDMLLVFLALGLADELLQMKIRQERTQTRLDVLLEKIEKSL